MVGLFFVPDEPPPPPPPGRRVHRRKAMGFCAIAGLVHDGAGRVLFQSLRNSAPLEVSEQCTRPIDVV